MVGQLVGKYRVLSRLGRGGMGTVYKALDETVGREVAIKSLNPDLADPEVLKRFRAEAVAHAHRAGIVHRDLKPANLMLTESGLVKVMDFGLARMVGTEHLTNDGFMVGTPAYMAPEQVLAEEIDGRADLYAMAVVFYRLLTSRLPFNADSGISMAHKQVHDAPTPVRAVRMELPAACEDIIGRALAKSPADRFQTAEEFKAALA